MQEDIQYQQSDSSLNLSKKKKSKQESQHLLSNNNQKHHQNEAFTQQYEYNYDEEPLTHYQNKSFFEKYITDCCYQSPTDLTDKEIKAFNILRKEVQQSIEVHHEECDEYLKKLWNLIYGHEEQLNSDLKSQKWQEIGFQNFDPRTDFRGGGLLSLKHILHFVSENGKKTVLNMSSEYLFAITSINVSSKLYKFFHLDKFLKFEHDQKLLCSRKSLKRFCKLILEDSDILEKIHNMLLKDLHEIWIKDKKKHSHKINIMHVQKLLDVVFLKLKQTFRVNSENIKTFKDVSRIYSQQNLDYQIN